MSCIRHTGHQYISKLPDKSRHMSEPLGSTRFQNFNALTSVTSYGFLIAYMQVTCIAYLNFLASH